MNKFFEIIAVTFFFFGVVALNAQNVGLNATGASPSADAILDITSADKGLLIPRVNILNLSTITPITGGSTTSLLVYNTNATTGLGYYYWDGNSWIQFLSGANVDNGLYHNAGASKVRLGGALVENTTITHGGYDMIYNLSGTGVFQIHDAGLSHFEVSAAGRTTFGEDTYWRDASTGGTTLGRFYDSGNDGVFQVYSNGSMQHSVNSVGETIFNEQGTDVDFRIESSSDINMFYVDAGSDRIGIKINAPVNVFDVLELTAIGTTDVMQSQLDGNTGGVLDAVSNNAANAYNALEAVHFGTGSPILAIQSNGANNTIALNAQTAAVNDRWGIYSSDNIIGLGFFVISDGNHKTNIKLVETALAKIKALKPVTYNFKEDNAVNANSETLHYGFTAQNVHSVIPDLVAEKSVYANHNFKADEDMSNYEFKYSSVNYQGLIPVLTKAVQEQQTIIESQNERIYRLEKLVNSLLDEGF